MNISLPKIIAHRGLCGVAPENTLASLHKAAQAGLTWVEFDVMLSKDKELVVFHDADLARTTNGQGLLRDLTLTQLKILDAGSWFAQEFADERIPSLQEVLLCCRDLGLAVNIELKPDNLAEASLVQGVLHMLNVYRYELNQVLLSSFSLNTLRQLKQLNIPYCLGWNLEHWEAGWSKIARELAVFSLHFPFEELTQEKIMMIKAENKHVLAFTVNSKQVANDLFTLGVDAVFSDVLTPFDD